MKSVLLLFWAIRAGRPWQFLTSFPNVIGWNYSVMFWIASFPVNNLLSVSCVEKKWPSCKKVTYFGWFVQFAVIVQNFFQIAQFRSRDRFLQWPAIIWFVFVSIRFDVLTIALCSIDLDEASLTGSIFDVFRSTFVALNLWSFWTRIAKKRTFPDPQVNWWNVKKENVFHISCFSSFSCF